MTTRAAELRRWEQLRNARLRVFGCAAAILAAGCLRPGGVPEVPVRVLRVPAGGAVPDALVDAGVIHAVYVRANDVWHVASPDAGRSWTPPVRVNADPGSVDEPGMFRGPSLCLGPAGRLHAVWYPLRRDRPASEWGIRYAHLDLAAATPDPSGSGTRPSGRTWSRPLALSRDPADGSSVAASEEGAVAVGWVDEDGLRIARSTDGGDSFAPPESVPGADPVRSCVSRGRFLPGGEFLLLYRDRRDSARRESVMAWGRGMTVSDRATLSGRPWPEDACPTTGGWLSVVPGPSSAPAAVAAWETGEEISWAGLDARGRLTGAGEVRTHAVGGRWPVVVANASGHVCVSWKESATIQWQVFNWAGAPLGPVRSQASLSPHAHSAVVLPDGSFLLVDAG